MTTVYNNPTSNGSTTYTTGVIVMQKQVMKTHKLYEVYGSVVLFDELTGTILGLFMPWASADSILELTNRTFVQLEVIRCVYEIIEATTKTPDQVKALWESSQKPGFDLSGLPEADAQVLEYVKTIFEITGKGEFDLAGPSFKDIRLEMIGITLADLEKIRNGNTGKMNFVTDYSTLGIGTAFLRLATKLGGKIRKFANHKYMDIRAIVGGQGAIATILENANKYLHAGILKYTKVDDAMLVILGKLNLPETALVPINATISYMSNADNLNAQKEWLAGEERKAKKAQTSRWGRKIPPAATAKPTPGTAKATDQARGKKPSVANKK